MVHENVDIPVVVKALRDESGDHHSVVFERPPRFEYEPGDWIDLDFGAPASGGRTYSLSSSPTEPDLVVTFKAGQSEVKRLLTSARGGDVFRITAYGNDYHFTLKQHRSSVLVAGGVGVAPFRSMLSHMADTGRAEDTHLVYFNKTDDFLFRSELDAWRSELPSVSIDYVTTQGLKSKERARLLRGVVQDGALYYVSGPPGMVESTEVVLMAAGVDHDDIRVDIFSGY